MVDDRVWIRYGDTIARFKSKAGKLAVSHIAEKWKLDPTSFFIGPDALEVEEGVSVDSIADIQAAARQVGAGDGKSKETAFTLEAAPAQVASGIGGGAVPFLSAATEDEVVSTLLKHYGDEGTARRTAVTRSGEDDLGQGFEVKGREETYELLLQGSAAMFRNFLEPADSLEGYRRDRPFTFAFVAFPGAGKTTIGTRAWSFLEHHWRGLTEEKRRNSLKLILVNEEHYQRYVRMCNNSLRFNLCMYHSLAHVEGGLFPSEHMLVPEKIFVLRCLAAILDRRDYGVFLQEFEHNCPGLKTSLSFKVLLKFLRAILPNLAEENELLVPFFFDEVNASTKDSAGNRVMVDGVLQHGEATWFQSILSAFILEQWRAASLFAELKVFPVVSIATTRFSAGNLKFTESAQTQAVAVPLLPLTISQSEEVVLGLLQQWARRFQQPVPEKLTESVVTLVKLAGGMPRMLSRALEATVASGYKPNDLEVQRAIFNHCVHDLRQGSLKKTIERWERSLGSMYTDYLGKVEVQPLLLRVLAHSMMVTPVVRVSSVMETGRYSHIRYSDLEVSGLVSLTVVGSQGQLHEDQEDQEQGNEAEDQGPAINALSYCRTTDMGNVLVLVRCMPLVVHSLLQSGRLPVQVDIPDLRDNNNREKEVDDLVGVLFRAYLIDVAFSRQEFTLSEVLPPGSMIPDGLAMQKFRLHRRCYKAEWWPHKDSWEHMVASYPDCTAFLGPGNNGPDSLVLLDKVDSHVGASPFALVVQSKQVQSQGKQAFTPVLRAFYSDMSRLGVQLGVTSQDLKGIALDLNNEIPSTKLEGVTFKLPQWMSDFGYIFFSNWKFSEKHIKAAKRTMVSKVVLAYEEVSREYNDSFSILSLVRTLRCPFDLVR